MAVALAYPFTTDLAGLGLLAVAALGFGLLPLAYWAVYWATWVERQRLDVWKRLKLSELVPLKQAD
jgi:hypothetical protein